MDYKKQYSNRWGKSSGSDGVTCLLPADSNRGLFSAIEEQVGEKGKMPYITSIMLQNHHTVLAYLFPIVPELLPQYEARKGVRNPVQMGN